MTPIISNSEKLCAIRASRHFRRPRAPLRTATTTETFIPKETRPLRENFVSVKTASKPLPSVRGLPAPQRAFAGGNIAVPPQRKGETVPISPVGPLSRQRLSRRKLTGRLSPCTPGAFRSAPEIRRTSCQTPCTRKTMRKRYQTYCRGTRAATSLTIS